jgi:hypothetical protein
LLKGSCGPDETRALTDETLALAVK